MQNQKLRFGPKKSHVKWRRSGILRASSGALLEFVPEIKKENLDFEFPLYDPSKGCCGGPYRCGRRPCKACGGAASL